MQRNPFGFAHVHQETCLCQMMLHEERYFGSLTQWSESSYSIVYVDEGINAQFTPPMFHQWSRQFSEDMTGRTNFKR